MANQELTLILRAVTDEFRRGMADMQRAVSEGTRTAQVEFEKTRVSVERSTGAMQAAVGRDMERIRGSVVSTWNQIRAAALAAIGGLSLRQVVQDTQAWAFEVEELAKRLGLGAREASAWAAAGRPPGTSVEATTASVAKLVQTLNTNEAAFTRNEVAIRDETGARLALDQVLLNTIRRYQELGAGAEQASFAQQLFGRGVGNITSLTRFANGLKEARELVHAFGLEMTESGLVAARDFDQSMDRMRLATLAVEEVLATALKPELQAL